MDLFAEQHQAALARVQPLAVRMRPRTLDEFVGQTDLLAPGRLLRRLIDGDCLTSAIFHGPPGCGKTTLARLIAQHTRAVWQTLHAAEAGVKDVRNVLEEARHRILTGGPRTVLFLDEIHRFNRAQQDVLLRDVEDGIVILIGATTENPYFAVNGPLISRSQVFRFTPLTDTDLRDLLRHALADPERGLGRHAATADDDALALLATRAAGDARRALAALEAAVLSERARGDRPHVTRAVAETVLQRPHATYDRTGDTHYDLASALIKSMRGSDPDAALYWLARMLEGGEDPRFIARRIAICAAEDIGNADPHALMLAAAAAQVTDLVGLPECQLPLAQAAVYLACAPKSNAVTLAINAARADVRDHPPLPVPPHLRDRHTSARDEPGAGDYRYPHDFPRGWCPQDYLGATRRYYNPTGHGVEGRLAAALRDRRGETGPAPSAETKSTAS